MAQLLVVDDERSMRELLEYMLTRAGYRVTLAENGRAAVDRIAVRRFRSGAHAISAWAISTAWMCSGPPKNAIPPPW